MSSAVVSTSAALGRLFILDEDAVPGVSPSFEPDSANSLPRPPQKIRHSDLAANPKLAGVTPASQLVARPAPEMASSGIAAIDALTGGLPRGCLSEICGTASSGRTTLLLAALAAATKRGEFCAVIDASDSLDPHSVAAAGVDLDRLLWVRCGEESRTKQTGGHTRTASFAARVGISPQTTFDFDRTSNKKSEHRLEQVLRVTDLLLESGGFGLIILDLSDVPSQAARRIPLATWFRFRRAVENKSTILLTIEQQPIAGSCSSLLLQLQAARRGKNAAHGASLGLGAEDEQTPEARKKISERSHLDRDSPTHAQLLTGLDINAELIRSRLDRKPARSIAFATKTAWAG